MSPYLLPSGLQHKPTLTKPAGSISRSFHPGTAEPAAIIAQGQLVFPEGFLVIDSEGTVVGCASSERWLAEGEPALGEAPFTTHHPNGRILCITAMAIQVAYQRQGLGSALLHALIRVAREQGCRKIILETTHAQKFHAKHGFQEVEQRHQGTLY